ncbi:hypothetical protein K1719_019250 [Acacia pycnantha]|nr:hypothetical protein K1719_019250 [Acacia pycnantha]
MHALTSHHSSFLNRDIPVHTTPPTLLHSYGIRNGILGLPPLPPPSRSITSMYQTSALGRDLFSLAPLFGLFSTIKATDRYCDFTTISSATFSAHHAKTCEDFFVVYGTDTDELKLFLWGAWEAIQMV